MAVVRGSALERDYEVQVLEVPAGFEDVDGSTVSIALVVLTRQSGMLLALPSGVIAEESLAAGLNADVGDLIGLSYHVTVEAGTKEDLQDKSLPVMSDGVLVDVLLVDVAISMRDHLIPYHPASHPLDLLQTFNPDDPTLFPMPDALVRATWDWIEGPASGELVTYYSAEEGDAVPSTPPVLPKRRARKAAPQPNGEGGGQDERKPRPTVASLAANLEQLSNTLPQIMQQMQMLNARTEAMEVKFQEEGPRPSALRAPLASSTMTGFPSTSTTAAALAKEFPPPKGSLQTGFHLSGPRPFPAQEVHQLESQVLTSLVNHLATGDPISDLSSSSGSLSSKGAMGRAKLQQELAQHRGTFFVSLLQSMARRMQPALPADLSVFQNKAGTNYARGRAFAPLADQRWITTALAFIKEMDLIAAKRLDATGKKADKDTTPTAPASKKEAKKPKGGGKKKNQQEEEDD
eukprot:s652_g16.t1